MLAANVMPEQWLRYTASMSSYAKRGVVPNKSRSQRNRKMRTTGRVSVRRICEHGKKLAEVLMLGTDKNGELYAACSTGSREWPVWLVEQFKAKLLAGE